MTDEEWDSCEEKGSVWEMLIWIALVAFAMLAAYMDMNRSN